MKVVIVDYGMANLRSVQKAFERVGTEAVISGKAEDVAAAERLVLPGVGAFRDAIGRLSEAVLIGPIAEFIRSGKPFLGICLGLQLLFERSFEDGKHHGLGLFAGDVVRLSDRAGLKIPHMGWNQLNIREPECPLLAGVNDGDHVYFVHSYYAEPRHAVTAATTDYPGAVTAVVWRDNVYATQFHPEKSQHVGLTMLANFARLG